MRRVLVTRPEPGASATAQVLRSAGFDPAALPLTEVRPLPADEFEMPTIDAVAVTSANALRHASHSLLARITTLPLYAVGEATADTAGDAGFSNVVAGPGDAAGLAAAMGAVLAPGSVVLYLCGKVRKPDFEQGLRGRGIRVITLETYDTVPVLVADGDLKRLGSEQLLAVLVHSAEAAKALAALATRPTVARLFEGTLLVAISRRAAAPAEAVFAGRIVVARDPTDAAMIEALIGSG
jgi:uroporphyrinogen-III synthase